MSIDLNFLHTGSSGHACEYARSCAQTFLQHGFSVQTHNVATFPSGKLLTGGTVFFFLGSQENDELHDDAIPFWLYLNSLNSGVLRSLHFAVYALGDRNHEQFCAFGNACNIKLGQLGGVRIHPFTTCAKGTEPHLSEWVEAVLFRLSPSRSSRLEALAA